MQPVAIIDGIIINRPNRSGHYANVGNPWESRSKAFREPFRSNPRQIINICQNILVVFCLSGRELPTPPGFQFVSINNNSPASNIQKDPPEGVEYVPIPLFSNSWKIFGFKIIFIEKSVAMAKGRDMRKNVKKEATLSLKEKRAAKREKKNKRDL